jgi:signal transduction histidine kinase
MLALLKTIYNHVKNNGYHKGIANKTYSELVFFNLFWLSYTAFFIVANTILLFIATNRCFVFLSFISLSTLLLLRIYFLVKKQKFTVAKTILLFLFAITIFAYHISFGARFGVYLYYFPLISICLIVFSWQTERFFITTLLVFIVTAYLFGFFFAKKITIFTLQIPVNYAQFILITNVLVSIGISIVYVAFLVHENQKNINRAQQTQLYLQTLIDNSLGSHWSIDNTYKVTAFNRHFKQNLKRNLNYTVSTGSNLKESLVNTINPKVAQVHQRALAGETFTTTYYSSTDWYEVSAAPTYDIDGQQNGATFFSKIITQQVNYQNQLQQASTNLQTLIDNMDMSVWSVAKDYTLIAANKYFLADMEKYFGKKLQPGFAINTLFTLPNYPPQWIEQYEYVFANNQLIVDFTYDDKSYELKGIPLRNTKSELIGAVFFAQDISARKQAVTQERLAKEKAQEASEEKVRFLSNMSHEIRTPLNGIKGLSELLMQQQKLPEQAHYLELLKHTSDHMLELVNNILDYNKIEAGKLFLVNETFNLKTELKELAKFFRFMSVEKNLFFLEDIEDALDCNIEVDIIRLRQIIGNLLSNAVKFTNQGHVALQAKTTQKTATQYTIQFTITDTGIGIPADKIDTIFESFNQADIKTTRQYGGTGLGLTIAKRLTQLMGGNMYITSTQNKGTQFWFALTLNLSSNTTQAATKSIATLAPFNNLKVLLVEDNKLNTLVASKLLERWNINIDFAENGVQAVDKAQNNFYHLILMDLEMPIMDGFAATEKIRLQNPAIPILAVTAASYDEVYQKLNSYNFTDYVRKPFHPEELHKRLAKYQPSI